MDAVAVAPTVINLASERPFRVGRASIDPVGREATFDGQSERLQPQNLKVLVALARKRGKVVTRDELVDVCWDGRFVGDDVINRAISNLRQFAERVGGVSIETVPRSGYRLVETSSSSLKRRQWVITAVALITVALAAIAFLVWPRPGMPRPMPTIAVTTSDSSSSSQSLADDLFVKLGALQSTKVEAVQLVEQGSKTEPDLRFAVAQRSVDGQVHANVALLAGDNGALLWSRDFQQERRSEADLRQQVAYSAALVLTCASEALGGGHAKLKNTTLKLYLAGCARLSDGFFENTEPLVQIFGTVAKESPDFEGGWAKLLIVETYSWLGSKRDPALGQKLKVDIKNARKLNPAMAEAYVAEGWMQELRQINRWMPLAEAAVNKNPLNAFALTEHANDMFQVGRLQEGVTLARRAVESDPLAPWVRDALVVALANAGEIEAAKDAFKDAERLWPGTSNISKLRYFLAANFGDAREPLQAREALQLLRSGKVSRAFLSPATESFLEAKLDPTQTKRNRAIQEARAVSDRWFPEYLDTLAEFGHKEELMSALSGYDPGVNSGPGIVFRPKFAVVRNDIRFLGIVRRWGQFDYWVKSGNWPDFCFDPSLPYDCKVEAAKLTRAPH